MSSDPHGAGVTRSGRRLAIEWKRRGHELGFSVGVANGYAMIDAIGFEGQRDYCAIGSVCNLAARLCML
jgi:class 3 adenylate cyclase